MSAPQGVMCEENEKTQEDETLRESGRQLWKGAVGDLEFRIPENS
jgi:hypothetical protein